jgi:hypothetical protein
MVEIKCPRCEQFWYDDDPDAGRVRLCDRCTTDLRRGRGPAGQPAGPFLFAVAGVLLADVLLIALTAAWPRVFGLPLALYGGALLVPGLVGLRRAVGRGHVADADGGLARWCLLFTLGGLACLLAVGTFVLRPH